MSMVGNQVKYSNNPVYTATGNGTTTAHTLTWTPGTVNALIVSLSGVIQRPTTDYTVSGTTLTFTSAPPLNVPILVVGLDVAGTIGVPGDATVTDAKLAADVFTATRTYTNKTVAALTNNVEARSGPDSSAFSFRNKVIGGDFTTNPWQRGTSFTSLTNPSAYQADQFKLEGASDATQSVTKTADAPTVAQAGVRATHCWHSTVTTADGTIAAGQYIRLHNYIEGYNNALFGFGQAGTRYVTLSFWVKATLTGTYCVNFSGATSSRNYVAEYSVSVSETWEKKVITIPVCTDGTWNETTGIGLNIQWILACGSSFNAATKDTWQTSSTQFATTNQVNSLGTLNNNFKLALIQLEAGQTATPFETRPVGVELALCQRYLPVSRAYYNIGQVTANNAAYIPFYFGTEARVAPTGYTLSSAIGSFGLSNSALSLTTCNGSSFSLATTGGGLLAFTLATGPLTAGDATFLSTGGAYILWTGCEL